MVDLWLDGLEKNSNIAKPLLASGAIKEAVEILSAEMNISLHFSKYPQDRWKNESEPPEISRLISTAEFHNKRWQEIKSVIDHLVVGRSEQLCECKCEYPIIRTGVAEYCSICQLEVK